MKTENATPEMLQGMAEHAAQTNNTTESEQVNPIGTIGAVTEVVEEAPEIWANIKKLIADAKAGDTTAAQKITAIVEDVVSLLELSQKIVTAVL